MPEIWAEDTMSDVLFQQLWLDDGPLFLSPISSFSLLRMAAVFPAGVIEFEKLYYTLIVFISCQVAYQMCFQTNWCCKQEHPHPVFVTAQLKRHPSKQHPQKRVAPLVALVTVTSWPALVAVHSTKSAESPKGNHRIPNHDVKMFEVLWNPKTEFTIDCGVMFGFFSLHNPKHMSEKIMFCCRLWNCKNSPRSGGL